MEIVVEERFCGPKTMGQGGYVAGLLVEQVGGSVRVTLRSPTPLNRPLTLKASSTGHTLLDGETVIAEAQHEALELDVPAPPQLSDARTAEVKSLSFYQGRGVHQSCFCCSSLRPEGEALRVFAAPCRVGDRDMVAAAWRPGACFAEANGHLPPRYVVSAVDCPGAFAFMVDQKPVVLLGRIVFEQFHPVHADTDHIVIGWRLGSEGRKHFAGTALFDADRRLLAAAKATWF